MLPRPLQIWRRRAGCAGTFLLRLMLGSVFVMFALAFGALRAGRIRSHRVRCCVLWIRWAVKTLLRPGSARLCPRILRPAHHSELATHFPELRSHPERTRAIEISHLRPVVLLRTRTRLIGTGTAVILRHPGRFKAARLPRPATLRECLPALLPPLRKLRIGLLPGIAGITHVRCVRPLTSLREIRRLEISVIGRSGPAVLVMVRNLRIGLMSAAIKSGALVPTARLALGQIARIGMPGCV